MNLTLFCRVVDNYGDIGICWRFARQLQHEHGVAVELWVDDLPSFRRICPQVEVALAHQRIEGVVVRHWRSQDGEFSADQMPELVIEFFGCELPPGYVAAMAQRTPRPVWLNLEGLSAEEWVEGCHRLPSSHPRLPLTKHFFFPGFTDRTGGLLCEAGLDAARVAFQADPAVGAAFLSGLGVTAPEQEALLVSLFCYPHAPVAALFEAWQRGGVPVTCLVPEGVAAEAVQAWIGAPAVAGAAAMHGDLTVRVLPFVAQPDYDRLLWACDLNFVRGEDSFVRAQWAGRPFVWHIYPQDENLHHKKLRAFLQRYASVPALADVSLAWNGAAGVADWPYLWMAWRAERAALAAHAGQWQAQMRQIGDMSTNLLHFVHALRSAAEETAL